MRTRATGRQGLVYRQPRSGLGQADAAAQVCVDDVLAGAGVTITTAAVYDFPVPSVRALRAAGANVACGDEGICDLWSPFGSGDMRERAMHVAYRSTFRRDAVLARARGARP